ncbi:phage major capsid protein [Fontivita pretiosa]|uniref:phage major capsid protein n=1 Tax=Fontivita pretiosa TaxID=2989684 RepID=UPI003D16AC6B
MSADGTALPDFADFVLATKAHKITPTTEILNECAKRTYFLALMLKGRGNDEVVQTGSKIIDQIQLKKMNNAGFYRPNQNLQPRGVDTLTQIAAPWRFHQGNYGWTNEQVRLNMAAGGNPVDIYTRLKTTWEQACVLDIWDSMESALWDTPDPAEMEADGGLLPYSIPTFLTADGLAPAGFTTVMTVNPATEPRWRNQTDTFDWSVGTAAATADVFYQAFDRMWRKLRWKRIRGFNSETGSPGTDFDKVKIVTNQEGVNGYLGVLRASNDRLRANPRGRADVGWATDEASFNNIEIIDVEELDAGNSPTVTAGAPPFYWLNFDYLFPVYHGDTFMEEVGPLRGSVNQPFSWAVYKNTYYNVFCRSRRRQGLIQTTA